jgi:UDP-N-acetyl-D-galactosamine dehydrogenase
MIKKDIPVNDADILILGITFKENCPDVRNTKTVDLISALKDYGANITIHDPWADEQEVLHEYGLTSIKTVPNKKFDAVLLTVSHNKFKGFDYQSLINENAIVYDVKNFIDDTYVDGRL